MRLFMVRHGQTEANLNMLYVGQGESPLTELGISQAKSIAPILSKINFQKVYSSDITRAVQTAKLALNTEPVQTPYLREIDQGDFCGLTVWEVAEKYGNAVKGWDYSAVNGESPDDVCKRLRLFLNELEKDPCENVCAFAHNGLLGCMLRLVLDADIDHSATVSNNCAIHVFEYDGVKWRLKYWNYGASLDADTTA